MARLQRFRNWLMTSRRFRLGSILVWSLITLIEFGRLWPAPAGDFKLHWELGRRMLAGQFIYEFGLDYPYPPFWGFVHIPWVTFDIHVAQLLLFPLAPIALIGLLGCLNRIASVAIPLANASAINVSMVAVLLTSRYLMRDMTECGVNLALVLLCWCAFLFWQNNRDIAAGISLGLAISLKCTPAAFLAYFLWKRQWKVFFAGSVSIIALSASPMLVMGPTAFYNAGKHWVVHASVGVTERDPSIGVLGPTIVQNFSLRPALARYLMVFPESHIGRIDHPGYINFMNLPPEKAGNIIRWLMIALALYVAFCFSSKVIDRKSSSILWEYAAIAIATLLYSPITWAQHCVAVLPPIYLLTRSWLSSETSPRLIPYFLFGYALIVLGLNRELLGQSNMLLLYSYRITTATLLGLLAILMVCWRASQGNSFSGEK